MSKKNLSAVKCDLISCVMKDQFEQAACTRIDFNKSMIEIDTVVDTILREYFDNVNAISDIYSQDTEDLNDTDFTIQKRNFLIRIAGMKLEEKVAEEMNRMGDFSAFDALISEQLDQYYDQKDKIREYYGCDNDDDIYNEDEALDEDDSDEDDS